MYVQRAVFVAQPGKANDMVAFIKKTLDRHPWPGKTRIYRSRVGEQNHVVFEKEIESLTAFEEIDERWHADVFTAEVQKEWLSLYALGGRSEFWVVEERAAGG